MIWRYVLKRLFSALVIIWAVASITFVIMHLAPGDPVNIYIRPQIKPEVVENIRMQMGFDLPVWKQYFFWLKEMSSGNFGFSFIHQKQIGVLLAETIPNTLKLTLTVFVFQYIVGILLGVLSALKKDRFIDNLISNSILILYSMPGFWMAIIAIFVFSLKLGWLPSSQMNSFSVADGFWPAIWDTVSHLILPVIILSVPFIAYTTRFVRSNLIDILGQPYILAARCYGFSERKILFQYALKNALLPLVTFIGLYLPFLLGGAVITEYIFAWPGMGRITVTAIFSQDYPLILATTLIAAVSVVMGNLISDILYSLVDPRIKSGMENQ